MHPRYEVVQSKVSPGSWYVGDLLNKKTVAVFFPPYGNAYAIEYAEYMNDTDESRPCGDPDCGCS